MQHNSDRHSASLATTEWPSMFTACGLGVCGRYDRLGLRDTVEKRHPYLELLRCSTQASNTTVSGKGNLVATYPRTSLPESALVLRELIVLKYISSGRARPLQATNPSTTPSGTRNRLLALIIKVKANHTIIAALNSTADTRNVTASQSKVDQEDASTDIIWSIPEGCACRVE